MIEDFEYYAVQDQQTIAGVVGSIVPGGALTHKAVGGTFWILNSSIEDPNVKGPFAALSREHGTLVVDDREYTILEISSPSVGLWGEKLRTTGVIQVKTPSEPDRHPRFLKDV